ncbi:MAG: IS21 family transposase, partial [Chloroflexota bacterium]
RSLADTYHVHRRVVRDALRSSTPPERKTPARARPKLSQEIASFIDEIIRADHTAPRKQRHTDRRILQRVHDELGTTISESTVSRYARSRRGELGPRPQVFVPQHHEIGRQAEVDFYEAYVQFPAELVKAQVITLRSEFSAAALHVAYPNQTQAALFEGIAAGLAFAGGVFPIVRFDNLTQAVARVLRGARRVEQDRFVAFRSHYGFVGSFTTPGIGGAHEKGGVENENGRFRRRWLTPVPQVGDWDGLNAYLHECSLKDLERTLAGRGEPVGSMRARERALLRPLPAEGFELAEVATALVDQHARITVRTNRYSVPVALVGRRVEVRVLPMTIEAWHQGRIVATHRRSHLKWQHILVLDHYLELLRFRPGAFFGSMPLHQSRARGEFPAPYEAMLARLVDKLGQRDAVRHMVEILMLHRSCERDAVERAVRQALELGVSDANAVAQLVRQAHDTVGPGAERLEVGELKRYERALPDLARYDDLLDTDRRVQP